MVTANGENAIQCVPVFAFESISFLLSPFHLILYIIWDFLMRLPSLDSKGIFLVSLSRSAIEEKRGQTEIW